MQAKMCYKCSIFAGLGHFLKGLEFDCSGKLAYMVEFSRSQYLTLDLSAINLGGQLQNIVGPMIFGESAASNSLAPLSMCVLTLSFTVIELRRILSLCRKKRRL
ncbi:hypothetical protein ACYULR_10825 [Lactobacillus delbrueckii subsp. lactis]